MRYRGDVADRGDLEADRLQRAQRALAARAGTLDLDLERANAMFLRLLAGILGGDLGGIRRRRAAALEAHHARGRPGDRIALRVGDGDHRIVEAGVHMRDAGGDVLALAALNALRFTCHDARPDLNLRDAGAVFPCGPGRLRKPASGRVNDPPDRLLLLAGDRLGLALAGARIGMRALAANGQALAM